MDALKEYGWLKSYDLFSMIDRNAVSDDNLITFILKVWLLAKHLNDVAQD